MFKVLVTMRQDNVAHYNELRDSLDNQWLEFLSQVPILPILLSNHLKSANLIIAEGGFDGVLLTGGGEHTQLSNDVRSTIERRLIEYCISRRVPLMGVCRGMQAIQSYFGIELMPVQGHITSSQQITISSTANDSHSRIVNSYHNYGTQQSVEQLKVWAKSNDGIVKAITHETHPITGIMWHPERESVFSCTDLALFKEHFLV